jgi:hypothetical protein
MNYVALVYKRTVPTKRLPHFDEVSAKFCGKVVCRVVSAAVSLRSQSRLSRTEPLLFLKKLLSSTHEVERTLFHTH